MKVFPSKPMACGITWSPMTIEKSTVGLHKARNKVTDCGRKRKLVTNAIYGRQTFEIK